MQYIQQQMKKVVATKKARVLHAQALMQSVTQLRTAGSAVTSLQARLAVRR